MENTIKGELLKFEDVDLSELLYQEVDLSNMITEGEKVLAFYNLNADAEG